MTERILKKLDEYLSKNDYAAAEKHLLYWLSDAEDRKDGSLILLLSNELMGLYRKLGRKDEALAFADSALMHIEKVGNADSVAAATTYINCATVYKAFSMAEMSIPLFEKAKAIYEEKLSPTDSRLGGLYNNTALALVDLKQFNEARSFYQKAIDVMGNIPNGETEQAITYLNLASASEAELGLEDAETLIVEYITQAIALLDIGKDRTDGNYAFVCEKCASVFGYYGYFVYENELKQRARRIYERD